MAGRKVFHDSIVSLAHEGNDTQLGLVVSAAEPAHLDEPLSLHFAFGLSASAQAQLEKRVATGEITSPQDAEYLPPESDVKKLTGWLKDQGFTIDRLAPDGIYATASTSKVAKSLAVDIVRVTRDGFTHNAARTAPSLPADLAKHVTAIGGLQPFLCAHRHSRLQTPEFGNRARLGRKTTGVTKTPPADDNVPPFMVSEILKAYDAEDLSETGDGQIIAILIDTFPDDDDVKAFWSKNGIPGNLARIEKINVKGGSLPPPAGEETLDVEWSSGIAQKARIRVYATGSLAFVDLDRALDEIIADVPKFAGLRQLSISLGLGETYLGGPTGEIATQHQKFLRLAAAGVNVFMSSGDAGSNPDQTGHSSSGPAQAEYAASDSCVIGVGGTSLSLTSRGTVARETGWANGGGGVSKFFDQPSWQKAKGAPKSKKRLVPDVSLVADPETGAFLILAGKATQIGGTSWSAPVGRLSARYATRPGKRQKKTHCRFSIPLSTSSPAHPLSATSMPAAMGCIPPIPDSTLSPDLVCQA